MSLINDALKRAKEAQEQTPPHPPEHLALRPVDPQVLVTHGVGLVLPVAFATVALLLLFFVWRFYMDKGPGTQGSLNAAASTPEAPAVAVQPAPRPAPVAAPAPASLPDPTNAPAQTQTPNPAPKPVASEPKLKADPAPATVAAAPAPAAVTEPVAPKLPPLMLQGVVYSRARPSAVISGKTVFVGDRVREFRVVAISADSATLVGNGQTNLLSLPD